MKDHPLVMSVAEVAKYLGVSKNLAYEGVHRGQIPSIRVGNSIRIPRAKLDEMMKMGNFQLPEIVPRPPPKLRASTSFSLTCDLVEQLRAAAGANGRSVSSEVEARLQASFESEVPRISLVK
jgi:excisionase family DNA binding protein